MQYEGGTRWHALIRYTRKSFRLVLKNLTHVGYHYYSHGTQVRSQRGRLAMVMAIANATRCGGLCVCI